MGIFQVGIIRVGVILGGSCPGGTYPGWGFSLEGVFRVGIFWGESSGWEFPGGRISSVLFFLEIKRNLCIDNFQILISNLFFDVRKYCF